MYRSILLGLNRLRLESLYCDAALLLDGGCLTAHKVVLAATSSYFNAAFSGSRQSASLDLSWMPIAHMAEVLQFMYTGELSLSKQTACGVRDLADFLTLEELIETCDVFIKKNAEPAVKSQVGTDAEAEVAGHLSRDSGDHVSDVEDDKSCARGGYMGEENDAKGIQRLSLKGDNACQLSYHHAMGQEVSRDSTDDVIEGGIGSIDVKEEDGGIAVIEPDMTKDGVTATKSCEKKPATGNGKAVKKKGGNLVLTRVKLAILPYCNVVDNRLSLSANAVSTTCAVPNVGTNGQSNGAIIAGEAKTDAGGAVIADDAASATSDSTRASANCGTQGKDHPKGSVAKGRSKCPLCEKTFADRSYIRLHMRKHTGEKPFKCRICSKAFSRGGALRQHMKTHTGERPYQCTVCSKRFAHSGGLSLHARRHKSERPYKCEFCSSCFLHKHELEGHRRIHTGEKPFTCEQCPAAFARPQRLREHVSAKHSTERPYLCSQCPETFANYEGLTHHFKYKHAVGSVTCRQCGEVCESPAARKRHYDNVHRPNRRDGKVFVCEICSKSYGRRETLRQHMKVHTGEKPFQCELCPMAFSQKGNLTIHMRRHTGEKPFSCDQCGLAFGFNTDLKRHMRVHTGEKPFTCEICSLRFAWQHNLKKHLQIHAGKKPYTCPVCQSSFSHGTYLKIHMRSHSGEKPFQCESCSAAFARRDLLKKHTGRHHARV